jgi:rfaE bifunctional protein nucleotidyltransferase chain/domain
LGDVLIVGLNTDASVKRQGKSPERPINNEQTRGFILAALQVVDAVILFGEDTPYELIKAVQPDILVKGADYKPEDIIGADIVKARGGQVITIELTQGFSTTGLIQKIKS